MSPVIIVSSPTQQRVLEYILREGTVHSLFRLASELGLDYAHAWRTVRRLEQRGLVTVVRNGPGKPLLIHGGVHDAGL